MLSRVRRLFQRPSNQVPELPDVVLRPIGVVRSGIKETWAPSWQGWREQRCQIVVRPELADALLGLDTYSHVQVVFWPHLVPEEVRGSEHRLHPRDDPANPLQGVLATRSQTRFNPLLITAVRLLAVRGNVVHVRGLDAVDGTPVLDLKPYIPQFDSIPEAKLPGWLTAGAEERREGADTGGGD
jgi:tRNA-Thr(GGU) m(6)t(6)A37 methyltransferase TsaA